MSAASVKCSLKYSLSSVRDSAPCSMASKILSLAPYLNQAIWFSTILLSSIMPIPSSGEINPLWRKLGWWNRPDVSQPFPYTVTEIPAFTRTSMILARNFAVVLTSINLYFCISNFNSASERERSDGSIPATACSNVLSGWHRSSLSNCTAKASYSTSSWYL